MGTPQSIATLIPLLTEDPWRKEARFSPDILDANTKLFSNELSSVAYEQVIGRWLEKNQPCLFGRIAARMGLLTYCKLSEVDLMMSDEEISKKIQQARLEWTEKAFEGKKSGFIVHVVSEKISNATPDDVMKALAKRICDLYLLEDVKFDNIHLDEVFLERPGAGRMTWKWCAGVNYFSSQGDKRWWHDHRFPAGMAFSVNSVGHMAKSGAIAKSMSVLDDILGEMKEEYKVTKVDSLGQALEFAMRTIDMASNAVSGKATWLLDLPRDETEINFPSCPFELPPNLLERNYCEYEGFYHTDHTLPSSYFISDIERPASMSSQLLDFTYLFEERVANPDFIKMGRGRRVRWQSDDSHKGQVGKISRMTPTVQAIDTIPRLKQVLAK